MAGKSTAKGNWSLLKEFRLTPDESVEEKDRKQKAMLKRLKQEDEMRRELMVGSGPELPPGAFYKKRQR